MPKYIVATSLNAGFVSAMLDWNEYLLAVEEKKDLKAPALVELYLRGLGLKAPTRPLMAEEIKRILRIAGINGKAGAAITAADVKTIERLTAELNLDDVGNFFAGELGAELVAAEPNATNSDAVYIDLQADADLNAAAAQYDREYISSGHELNAAAARYRAPESGYARVPGGDYGAGPAEASSPYGAGPAEKPSDYSKPGAPLRKSSSSEEG